MSIQPIDIFVHAWLIVAVLSAAYVAWDQFTGNPEPAVMKWGFVLVTLYMGPIGLLLYVMADKEPRPGGHEEFVKPLWKQGVGSTVQIKVIRSTRRSSTASTSLPVRQDKKSGSTRSAGWPKRPAFRSLRAGEGPHAL